MEAARVALFGVFGLVFGSFLTVVVYRLPRKQSVVAPRSACPTCGAEIGARDNVPVFSWLWLRGRCRRCASPISAEYPLVEAAVGGLFVAAALSTSNTPVAAMLAVFLGVLFAAALIDVRHRIIPNRLTYPSAVVFGAAVVAIRLAGGPVSLAGAGIGLLAYGGALLVVALLSGGMGMGDVKLAAVIGLVLGAVALRDVAVAAGLAVLAGGVGAVVALLLGRSRKDTLPFGPYLALGGGLAALFGPQLAAWYGAFFH